MCAWFQDFLRSIPGSLLCCELHGEWVDVLEEEEEEEEEEQVQDIKRCTCTHSTLLIYLFQYHLLRFLMQILTNSLTNCKLTWFDSFPIPLSSFLQNDLSSAQRECSAATLPVSHAARYPRQRPGEPDDEFQFISVHRAQHALASWCTL